LSGTTNKLFIELYLDEDVSVLVADLVKAHSFIATTVRDAGMLRRSDTKQLEYATKHQNALLTHNRGDFEILAQEYAINGLTHSGIIIATRRSPYLIAGKLLLILNHFTADEIENQVW
jgi:predicted nuclease of predicted toxin-antitoxin system